MHSVDIETAQHSNTGLIQISTASDSSPGSLSSSSTAGSDRPVQPASPPQLAAFLVSSPKAPPASLTASKPILTSYHSASNPQPFFPTMAETPTTWQFPAAVHQSGMRTPSPPSPSTADHRPRPARSTPTHVRPRRHSMDEGRQAPASAGRPSALASTSSGDATNQLEAKVVIRECSVICASFLVAESSAIVPPCSWKPGCRQNFDRSQIYDRTIQLFALFDHRSKFLDKKAGRRRMQSSLANLGHGWPGAVSIDGYARRSFPSRGAC